MENKYVAVVGGFSAGKTSAQLKQLAEDNAGLMNDVSELKARIEALEKDSEWVSAKKELPKESGAYIVWMPKKGREGMEVSAFFEDYDFLLPLHPAFGKFRDDISHWRLPKPPAQKKDK